MVMQSINCTISGFTLRLIISRTCNTAAKKDKRVHRPKPDTARLRHRPTASWVPFFISIYHFGSIAAAESGVLRRKWNREERRSRAARARAQRVTFGSSRRPRSSLCVCVCGVAMVTARVFGVRVHVSVLCQGSDAMPVRIRATPSEVSRACTYSSLYISWQSSTEDTFILLVIVFV